MEKVFISGAIPKVGLDLLKNYQVEMYNQEDLISEDELCERVKDKDALLCLLSTPVTRRVIDSSPALKIIANYGAGYDNIDVAYAREKGIIVTNTPVVSTEATAELTMTILLATARRVVEGDQLCRNNGFKGWAPLFFLGREIAGKTLGIIGFGNIGRAVAKRAKAFGLNILYTQRHQADSKTETELNATFVSQDELLVNSDFITLNCAYNSSMKHMMNQDAFKKMKKTAYLINAARGALIDEKALIWALKEKEIEGAALDVFEFEPKISDELKTLNNVVLTPHIGNATIETRNAMAEIASKNIVQVLSQQEPLSAVIG